MRELLQQALDFIKLAEQRNYYDCSVKQQLIVKLEAELAKPEQNKPLRLSSMYEYGHIHKAAQPEQDTLLIDLIKELHAEIDRLRAKIALNKKADNARKIGLDYEPDVTFTDEGNKQEPVAEVNLAKPGYINWLKLPPKGLNGGEFLYTSTTVSANNRSQTVDHGFDRTASHMAGEYVDTSEQRTHKLCFCTNIPLCTVIDKCMKQC